MTCLSSAASRAVRPTSVLAALLLAAQASAIAPRQPEGLAPGAGARLAAPPHVLPLIDAEASQARAAGDAAWKSFADGAGGTWVASWDQRTDRLALAWGSGIAWPRPTSWGPDVASESAGLDVLETAARGFMAQHPGLFRVPAGVTLVRDEVRSVALDGGRIWQLTLRPHVGGVPVEAADVTFRTNAGRLVQFGSTRIGDALAVAPARPAVPAAAAVARVRAEVAALFPATKADAVAIVDEPRLSLRPWSDAPRGATPVEYRLAWTVRATLPGRHETWECLVDAVTGQRLALSDANRYACPPPARPQGRVVGGVFLGAVEEVPERVVGLPFAEVDHGTAVSTDYNGTFPFTPGTTASTSLSGTYFDMDCVGCSSPAQASARTAAWGNLTLGVGGTDEIGNGLSTRAERNCFYHLGVVRQLASKHLTNAQAGGFLDRTTPAVVNINDSCNAFWNGNGVNFFRSSGGCNNTGEIADVMQHEWGHGLDQFTGGGMDGARGEGIGDVVAFLSTHDSRLGPYFFRGDAGGLRQADEDVSGLMSTTTVGMRCPMVGGGGGGPLGYEVHCEGEIFSQAWWHLAESMRAKLGEVAGWHATERLFFQSLPTSDTYVPGMMGSTYSAVMVVDDDDGDLADGTPNAAEINGAFQHHGMAGAPTVPDSADCTPPAAPAVTLATARHPATGLWQVHVDWAPVPAAVQYLVVRNDAGAGADVPVAVVLPPTTELFDDDVTDGMTYAYRVLVFDAAGCTSTADNRQQATVGPLVALGLAGVTADDSTGVANANGVVEPGETIVVTLDVGNVGSLDATSVVATVTSEVASGVTITDGVADVPDLAVGATASSLAPHVTITLADTVPCGSLIPFSVELESAEGCSFGGFVLQVGLPTETDVLVDDLETDLGWTPDPDGTDTATTGHWELGDPVGTGPQSGEDHTPAPGVLAWVTGNSAANPGNPGDDDVDGGCTTLQSAVYDLRGQPGLTLGYWRWLTMSRALDDVLRIEISNDGGAGWTLLEVVADPAAEWREARFDLDTVLGAPANLVTLRFTACDTGQGTLYEAAVDDLRFFVEGATCESATPRPRLEHEGVVLLDDSGGNANGALDPGETVALSFDLRNDGNAAATRVAGTLAVLGGPAGTQLTDASGDWADVAAAATGRSLLAGGFRLRVPEAAACGDLVQLELVVAYQGASGTFQTASRQATVQVGATTDDVLFFDDFDSPLVSPMGDNGFTHGADCMDVGCDDWHRDVTTTSSPWDPPVAHSGAKAWGNDLGGVRNGTPWNGNTRSDTTNWLHSRAIDCSTATGTTLSFWRWLTVEDGAFDHARVQVGDGTGPWTTVWENAPGADHVDTAWTYQELDISAVADGLANLVVRFEMQTDGGLNYGGWTIDDLRVFARETTCEPVNCGATGTPGPVGPVLRATGRKDQDGAEFSWAGAPLGADESFRLFRGTTPTALSVLLTAGPFTATSHDDRTAPGALYFYSVARENCAGVLGPFTP